MSLSKRILESKQGSKRSASNGKMYAVMFGADEVANALRELEVPQRRSYEILITVSQPVIEAIRSLLPVKSGSLYRSIQAFRSKRDWYRRIWIGPRYIKGGGPDAGNHAHFIEYGTEDRMINRDLLPGDITRSTYEKFKGPWFFKPFSGKQVGRVKAVNFMQRAYSENKDRIETQGREMYLEALAEEAKKKGFKVV